MKLYITYKGQPKNNDMGNLDGELGEGKLSRPVRSGGKELSDWLEIVKG
jgi:hypothetical protein